MIERAATCGQVTMHGSMNVARLYLVRLSCDLSLAVRVGLRGNVAVYPESHWLGAERVIA